MSNKIGSAGANQYDDRTFRWANWYASSHAKQLHNNRLELERKGISIESVLVEIAGHTSTREHPWTLKIRMKQERDFQKTVMARILLSEQPDGPARIREILTHRQLIDKHRPLPRDISNRYKLAGPPAQIARRVYKNLLHLKNLVPPRVCAAVFRTIWNGWCTERRFQRRWGNSNVCMLGCKGGLRTQSNITLSAQ